MNKKLTKVLSIFLMAGIIGTGAAVSMTGCGPNDNGNNTNNEQTATVTGVTVTAKDGATTVEPGRTLQFSASVAGTNSPAQTVTWSIDESSTAIDATISATGLLTAGEVEGEVTVVATSTADTTKSGKLKVTVAAAQVPEVKKYTVSFDMNGHGKAPVAAIEVNENTAATAPTAPVDVNYDFKGWFTDAACTTAYDFSAAVTANVTLYAKWEAKVIDDANYEEVTTVCDLHAMLEATGEGVKLTEDVEFGKFKFSAGCYFNASSGNMTGNLVNNQQKAIYFTLDGVGTNNSIKFDAKGAGKGVLTLYNAADDSVVHEYGEITDPQYGLEVTGLTAGVYYIKSVGSLRLGNISVTEKLEKSSTCGITIKGGVRKELEGRQFSYTGLTVLLNYSNGRQDTLSGGYEVDDSQVDMSKSGVYTVTVKYKADDAAQPYTATYEIVVYNIDSVSISDHSIDNKRVTHPVQKIFAVGETFNSNNLAVNVTCSAPNSDKTESFILSKSEYSISAVTDTTAGKKTVTVTVGSKTASYDVYYIDVTNADTKNLVVDAAATGVTKSESGVFTVQTVNQAMQALKILGAADTDTKTVTVKAGEYKEKVEIDVPNVRLIGDGATAADTVLWCDVLAGQKDPSGTSAYSTDGSASVSIRAAAEGFYAEKITFKNYYNTNELYNYTKTLMSDTQAVACLVQADKSYFKNCNFTSYHDTLYAMDGRQVYDNCYIEGRTDYIFGAAATCYFKQCTIKSIGADDAKNGGYVVATKGTPGLLYGYIFDGCTLTADEHVVPGTVSLARGWDNDMTIAYVNCNISAAFSLTPYGTKTDSKNERYTNMNAKPKAAQLFEYNNTGDGALTADIIATADATTGIIENTCVYLNAESVTQFTTMSSIFAKVQKRTGATDFATSYVDDWDGTPGAAITAKTLDFAIFTQNYAEVTVKDYFAKDFDLILPEADKHATRWNGNSIQLDIGAKLVFKYKGKIYIDWYSGNYGNAANGVVTYKDGYATLEIRTSAGNSGVYIKNIKIAFDEVPADTQNKNVTYALGYEGAPEATVVEVPEGNMAVQPEDPARDGYDFAGWYVGEEEFDFKTLITADVTLTAHWNEITDLTIVKDVTYAFTGDGAYSGTVANKEEKKIGKMVVKAGENGSFVQHDGSWYKLLGDASMTLSLKAGAKVTIVTYDGQLVINGTQVAADKYVDGSNGKEYTHTVAEDGDVVISKVAAANQAYIKYIIVETTDALLKEIEETASYKYDGTTDDTEYFALHGCATNGDWLRFEAAGSRISFKVKAGAVITIGGSPYDDTGAVLAVGTEELERGSGDIWTYTALVDGQIDLVNVGGRVFIKTIKVTAPVTEEDADVLKAGQSITFGSEGNHVGNAKLTIVSGSIRDNGGNNSQINDGTVLQVKVKKGTVVVVSSYKDYTNYTVKIGDTVISGDEALTGTEWTYVATADCTLSFVSGSNNYFYSISAVIQASEEYTFKYSSVAAKYQDGDVIESTPNVIFAGCKRHDGTYVALKENNSIKLYLVKGSMLTVNMPYSNGVKLNGTDVTLVNNCLTYIATQDGFVEITGTPGNAYFTEIKVEKVEVLGNGGEAEGAGNSVDNPGKWVEWNDQNWCGSNVTVNKAIKKDNAIYGSYSATGACTWGFQLFYTLTAEEKAMYKDVTLTVKVNKDGALREVNGTFPTFVAGEAQTLTLNFKATGASIQLVFDAKEEMGTVEFEITDITFNLKDFDLTKDGEVKLAGCGFTAQGNTKSFRGITVDGTNGKFADRGNDVQINEGTKLSFAVKAGTTADKLSVTFKYNGTDQYLPAYTVAVADGVATVTFTGSGYATDMFVAYAAEGGNTEVTPVSVTILDPQDHYNPTTENGVDKIWHHYYFTNAEVDADAFEVTFTKDGAAGVVAEKVALEKVAGGTYHFRFRIEASKYDTCVFTFTFKKGDVAVATGTITYQGEQKPTGEFEAITITEVSLIEWYGGTGGEFFGLRLGKTDANASKFVEMGNRFSYMTINGQKSSIGNGECLNQGAEGFRLNVPVATATAGETYVIRLYDANDNLLATLSYQLPADATK